MMILFSMKNYYENIIFDQGKKAAFCIEISLSCEFHSCSILGVKRRESKWKISSRILHTFWQRSKSKFGFTLGKHFGFFFVKFWRKMSLIGLTYIRNHKRAPKLAIEIRKSNAEIATLICPVYFGGSAFYSVVHKFAEGWSYNHAKECNLS